MKTWGKSCIARSGSPLTLEKFRYFLLVSIDFPICPASACAVAPPEKARAGRANHAQIARFRQPVRLTGAFFRTTKGFPKNSEIYSGTIKLRAARGSVTNA